VAINSQQTFLELVSSYHADPTKFIFFVGAGLSQPLFPSWGDLLKDFIEQAKTGNFTHNENELSGYIDRGEQYLDIAETCVTAMGTTKYRDIMEKIFDKNFSESDIPNGYRALMNLSPRTIITTNYDRIPDIAGKGHYRINTNKNAAEASRFVADNKNIVFKIHGDITDQSSIVLTSSDYQEIIHKNPSTKNFLNSLLSTKILIFIGFSLSDPHINLILDNIRSINNGLPLSHYVLLNENSKFRISSFEKKYGVKIISYTPSDKSHPEVAEFLHALNHESAIISEKILATKIIHIDGIDQLITHSSNLIEEVIIGAGFSVFYNDSSLHISFTPSGETKGEIQKEILSIIRLMKFECTLIDKLCIYVAPKTPLLINFDQSQSIAIKASLSFSIAKKYANKEISTSTIWKLIKFHIPPGLSNVFQNEELVEFSMSTGIIEEHS
jgi:SIR2-like domain